MAKFKIYKLHFISPLHLSNEREDYAESLRTFNSDSMYAAITACLAKLGHKFAESFDGDLGFTISSLFPFYQEKSDAEAVFFLPKSKKTLILEPKNSEYHKFIKKLQWIDKDFFEEYINGKDLEQKFFEFDNTGEKFKNIKGAFMTNKNIKEDFIASEVFPRVTVPRYGEKDADPFYMERVFFKDYSGLFFIADGNTNLLEKGLSLLQNEGIGTDRNVGNGFFEFGTDYMELNLPSETDFAINISLFLPESKEQLINLLGEKSAYNIKKRGGWITTPPDLGLRKNRIFMFEEGSVFDLKINEPKVLGKIADLTPNLSEPLKNPHKIFRNGKSIFIPVILK